MEFQKLKIIRKFLEGTLEFEMLISIIVACYNQGHFIEDALNSILEQDYENFEVIIINDGSTDNTKEIVTEYSKKDAWIKLINQKNQGLSAARNTGLKNSSGKFILFLDADDWLERDFFETYSNAFTLFPDFDLYRCGYSYWSADRQKKYHTHIPTQDGLIYPNVVNQNIGACHSILIRKSLADQLGEFDTSLKSCEDWDYWIRAGKVGAKIKSIPQDLVGYRYITDSMSRNAKVMYASLTEVTYRGIKTDQRLSSLASFNQGLNWEISPTIKIHFIKCLGILLHQGKVEEALIFYQEEQTKWNWNFDTKDFAEMNSQLTFRYFLDKKQINHLLKETLPNVELFFFKIGFSEEKIKRTIQVVFEPQLKKHNHLKYGRLLGILINRIKF